MSAQTPPYPCRLNEAAGFGWAGCAARRSGAPRAPTNPSSPPPSRSASGGFCACRKRTEEGPETVGVDKRVDKQPVIDRATAHRACRTPGGGRRRRSRAPFATSGEREKAAAVGAAAPILRQEIVLAPVRGHRPSPFDAAVHSSSVRLSFKRTANGNGSVEKLQRVQRLWALPSSGFRQKKRFYRSTLQERYIRMSREV